jgi:SAM-dependent methyltransferase
MADEWYDFADFDHFWMKWRFEALKKIVPRDYVWGEILDIGCGNGIVGEQIERCYGHKTCGCDVNLSALRMTSSGRNPLYFYNIHERYKRFKEAFSTVLLMDVLEHIDDPLGFLHSVSFHLKPEGSLIINVPAIQLLYSKYDKIAGHVKRYSISSLRNELNSAGFRLEKAAYWGMSLIPLLLIRKFLLCFCKNNKVIEVGFQPMFFLVDKILDFIRRFECRVFPMVPVGISLMVLAKKLAKER